MPAKKKIDPWCNGNTEVFGSYSLREGRLVGCGSKRGGSVVYDSVSGSYATWCDDFKAK